MPRLPKLNGHVERARRAYATEFHEIYNGALILDVLIRAQRRWEYLCDHIRPKQSLDYHASMCQQ